MSTGPLSDLLRLSVPDRIELIEELWDSVADDVNADPSRLPLSDAHRSLLRSRSEAYRRNPGAAIPLDEALERIERSLD
ncbi:MAG TPA: addiction module protein [Longimicrobium sp.]